MLARMPSQPPKLDPPVSGWLLVLVATAVLLAHFALLTQAPLTLSLAPTLTPTEASVLHFNTRRIEAAPPRATAAPSAPTITPVRRPLLPALTQEPSPASANPSNSTSAAALDSNPTAPGVLTPVPTPDLPPASTETSPDTQAVAPNKGTVDPAVTPSPEPVGPQASAGSPYDPNAYHFVPPPSVRMTYQVQLQIKGFSQSATAEMRWALEGDSYSARLEVRHWLAGARIQTSTGQMTRQGLAPTRFSDKVRNEVAAHFERDKALVTFSANTPSAPLLPGMQDRLSVFMQLASLLAGASPPLPTGTSLLLPVAGPRAADVWRMTVEGNESLTLPGGTLSAVKLMRLPQKEYDQKLELWLAPSMGFLPVRIRLTDANGDVADQLWQSSQWP